MEGTYLWPPSLSDSYHPRFALLLLCILLLLHLLLALLAAEPRLDL
jgi:hypothetical protein